MWPRCSYLAIPPALPSLYQLLLWWLGVSGAGQPGGTPDKLAVCVAALWRNSGDRLSLSAWQQQWWEEGKGRQSRSCGSKNRGWRGVARSVVLVAYSLCGLQLGTSDLCSMWPLASLKLDSPVVENGPAILKFLYYGFECMCTYICDQNCLPVENFLCFFL